MVLVSGPAPSIQFSWDGPGVNGAGQDGQALLWNQAQGKFVMGSAGISDHGSLAGLADDDHAGYVVIAPTTSTRNVIQPTSAGVVPLVVKGASAQTAALQTWQNSAGTVLLQVTASGQMYYGLGGNGGFATFGAASFQMGTWGTVQAGVSWLPSVTFGVVSMGAGNVGMVVRGASGQTARIFEAQVNGGTIVGYTDANGRVGIEPNANLSATPVLFLQKQVADGPEYPPFISCKNSAGTSKFLVNWDGSIAVAEGLSFTATPLITLGGGGTFTIRDGAGQTLFTLTHGSGNAKLQQFSAAGVALTVRGATAQTAHLLSLTDISAVIQFAVGASGKLLTNQAVTNTNTPSGVTAKAMPFYDVAGTLLGYAPLYAAPW